MKPPAYFDTSTGKIMNCEKGTLLYFHEEGHKKWFKEGKEQNIEFISEVIITLILPLVTFYSTKNLFLTTIAALPLIFDIISETHAWCYGLKKWSRKRK